LEEAPVSDRELLIAYIQGAGATSKPDIQQSLHDRLDSLMAVELSSLIRTELQVDLPIRAFIEDPSIANLTLLIDQLIPGVPKQML